MTIWAIDFREMSYCEKVVVVGAAAAAGRSGGVKVVRGGWSFQRTGHG